MRKAVAAIAAIPILAALYLPILLRRRVVTRIALVCGTGAIIVAGVAAAALPRGTVATQAPVAAPIPAAEFRPVVVAHGLVSPIIVDFNRAMNRASVEANLTVAPDVPLTFRWSDDSMSLAVIPADAWLSGTFHTLTIGPAATDSSGAIIDRALRSVFLTREGVIGAIAASDLSGRRTQLDSRFLVTFDAPVDVESAIRAFRSEPSVPGTWTQPAPYSGTQLLFTPLEPLEGDTRYTFSFDGDVRALDGAPLGVRPLLAFRTEATPSVVRFRPRPGWTDVEREADLSVRFTRAMDRTATAAAFSVKAGDTAIKGTVRWAEGDTVLVFNPSTALPYGAKVTMRVDTTATSASGAPIEASATATFRVEKRPVARTTTTTRISTGGGSSGGGSTGSATWYAVEKYYFKLLTCTRSGGLVTSSGSCSGAGGSGLQPLALSSGISSKVARPYAKRLAVAGVCDHWAFGTSPSSRLKAAGYTSYVWGENLGCRSGNPYSAVLGSHLYFQSERSYNGGHWRNIMDPDFDRVGIGVWVYSGRVRLVTDFYHP